MTLSIHVSLTSLSYLRANGRKRSVAVFSSRMSHTSQKARWLRKKVPAFVIDGDDDCKKSSSSSRRSLYGFCGCWCSSLTVTSRTNVKNGNLIGGWFSLLPPMLLSLLLLTPFDLFLHLLGRSVGWVQQRQEGPEIQLHCVCLTFTMRSFSNR